MTYSPDGTTDGTIRHLQETIERLRAERDTLLAVLNECKVKAAGQWKMLKRIDAALKGAGG